MKRNFGLSEAEPGEHAAHKAVLLRHGAEGFEHLAVDQAEVAGVARDVDRRQAAEQFVEQAGGPLA